MPNTPVQTSLILLAAVAVVGLLFGWWRRQVARLNRQRDEASERETAERRSAEEERTFHLQLLDTLHEAVVGCDSKLQIRSWNAAAERLYGWSAGEVIGRSSQEVLRTEYPDGEAGRERAAAELGKTGRARAEVVQYHRSGERIEVEAEATALRAPDGRIRGYLVAATDLTERRQAEEALRASEAKFRAAFEGAGMGILILDREGRVVEHNRALGMILHHGETELRRGPFADLLHPDDVARWLAVFREMLDGNRDSITDERRFRREDGSWLQAIVRSTVVHRPSGEFRYCISEIEDVTQKKAMEAQLLFADRMSSMGTLAAGVAHEINNPLAFIMANISYALEQLRRPDVRTGEALRALEEALEGAARVREIVRDLKTFSRPEEKPGEVVDIRQVLRSSMNLAQNEIRHRARLVVNLQEVPPVAASAHRIGQVFLNLLINAAQAIPEGHADRNEIRVSARLDADWRVLVEIADTGAGIPPETLPRIFDPFFTTKPVGVGTGLGLSICHGIVTGLGGAIRVQTRPGEGSTFQVLLPTATPGPGAGAAVEAVPRAEVHGRILVVDDDAMVGRAVGRILSLDHQVVSLTSARAALSRLLEDGSFDVILCDLMMPEMTGMELHDELAKVAPALSRRMVFLTGGAFTPDAREFLERVPNPRVEKPFDPRALRAMVSDLLARLGRS